MDQQQMLDWLTDVLSVQGRSLTLEDTRMSVSEWDSLGALMLMSRLEEDHGIIVKAEEMARLNSVREICDILEMHKVSSR
jgi:acyl carrier protein